MTDYTRVTIQGEGRKADLVLPDDEPIAAVLPDVLSLLAETTERSSRPVVLMTTVGEQLSPALTLAEQNVEHGTILRLVRVDEAPPPPEVADVTDLMGDAVATRPDRWRPVWGTAATTALAAVATALGTSAAAVAGGMPVQIGAGVLVLIGLAIVLGRRGATAPAVVLTGAGVGALGPVSAYLRELMSIQAPGALPLLWFGLAGTTLALVGLAAFTDRAIALGGVIAALLVGAWALMQLSGVQPVHAAAWVAILGVLVLGLLPGFAMAASGLTGLDDRVVEGTRVSRTRVLGAVETVHRALTWATVAAAVPVAVCAWTLARSPELPAQLLAVAVGLIALLRTQVLPLAPQRLALIASGAVPLATLIFGSLLTPAQVTLAAVVLTMGLAVIAGARLSDNTRARLRRWAGIIEMVAVLSLLPLLLWLLGIFADLVRTFLR